MTIKAGDKVRLRSDPEVIGEVTLIGSQGVKILWETVDWCYWYWKEEELEVIQTNENTTKVKDTEKKM